MGVTTTRICARDDCDNEFVPRKATHVYCSQSCVGKVRAAENIRRGPDNHLFNGGLSQSAGRTIIVTRDYKYIYYARGVMAAHIGRLLRSDELVHHINGDRTDDRIENLEIVTRGQHINLHRAELEAARKARKAAP